MSKRIASLKVAAQIYLIFNFINISIVSIKKLPYAGVLSNQKLKLFQIFLK